MQKNKFNANDKILSSVNLQLKYVITINSSSKRLEIMIKKHSLFFQISLLGKSFCFSAKNRF